MHAKFVHFVRDASALLLFRESSRLMVLNDFVKIISLVYQKDEEKPTFEGALLYA